MLLAPNCLLVLKYKRKEKALPLVIEMREVLTCVWHPFQRICNLMAMLRPWKIAVDVLKSRELIAMPQMLHTMRGSLSTFNESANMDQDHRLGKKST